MKLRILSALIVAGSFSLAQAQDATTPSATGANAGTPSSGQMTTQDAMEKCKQEPAGEARNACLDRHRAESAGAPGVELSDRNNDGRLDGTRESGTPKENKPPQN
jgi:hypothetical protein